MKNNLLETRTKGNPENGFFAVKGEMAKLVQIKDWSNTPLGPIESWPQSLRSTVSLCLASNLPINIIWGPDRVQIYNDGYRPICGDMHPTSMGQDFKECWLSVWHVIGQAFEDASLGQTRFLENQRMFLNRFGYLEETFFTFSFSPILDDLGGVGGLFHPVTELTQQTLVERRLNILRTLVDHTSNAQTTDEASKLILETLKDFELDVPFVLLYSNTADGKKAILQGVSGLEEESVIAPKQVYFGRKEANSWPLGKVVETGKLLQVNDLEKLFGTFTCTPYPESPSTALVFPINLPGTSNLNFFLVAGVSARRVLDKEYRLFYELLVNTVTNALTKARTYEEETKRVQALAELDRAKTAFFSNISHEFRTPLTLMLGPLEDALLDQSFSLPAKYYDRLKLVQRNTLRLQRLVNSLLDFSQIEAGRLKAAFQLTNLAAYTKELASIFQSAMDKAGLQYIVNCQPINDPVFIDQDMWEKILFNLLSNALKFTFHGKVEVSLAQEDGRVLLKVSDTGEGIALEELPNLFKRFYRIEGSRSRSHEGSGIGLAFVLELVKLHGGTISAESKQGKGTTFTVSIPTGSAHLAADRIVTGKQGDKRILKPNIFIAESMNWLSETKFQSSENYEEAGEEIIESEIAHILVVDDNADMREYVSRILSQKRGWKVQNAGDGFQALEVVGKQKQDVILSDIMMPNMDGFQLLKQLKSDISTSNIPVILLSARAGEDATIEGLEKGADDYLVKPFSGRELIARVRTQLEITKTRQDNTTLREAEEELKKFKILSDYAFDPFILMKEDGSFAYLNDLALERWGYTREEAQNLRVPNVDPLHNVDKFNEVFGLAQNQLIPPFETLHKRKDGQIYPVEVSMGGITLKGKPHMFAIARDITERKKYEEVLLQNEAELQKKVNGRTSELIQVNKELEQFTYGASHDMQEPLRKIQTYSSMLEMHCINLLDETGKRLLSKINSSSGRMKHIIDDLLNYSQQTKESQNYQVIDLNKIVDEIQQDLELLILEKQATIIKDTLPHIQGVPGQINQLFFNLLSNALKFSKVGRPVTIKIEHDQPTREELFLQKLDDHGAYIKMMFSDNGIGFEQQHADQIFNLFNRLHPKADYDGTGIGLGLCKRIVQNHKGAIWAKSFPQEGATFNILLPKSQ